jgi:hypothetical protein
MVVATKIRGTNALAEIIGWCGELPGWQQDALRRIVENGELTPEDIRELVAVCKHAHGLEVEDVPECRPLRREHLPKGLPAGKAVTLCSIAEPENVNALDQSQELKFAEKGLTVVFGYNGSGKSGYGRVLRRACRARSTGSPILPNVLRGGTYAPATAVITYALDGVEQKPEQWIDQQRPVEALGSVSFFDTDCAAVHVSGKHNIAFTPVGLDLLPKLGTACKDVQKCLDDERKKLEAIRPRLLQSPPGCGKSQFCKALGNETGRPTLVLDVGALMGSLVGQSEANIRQALRIADAMAPCVLFVDELEKALSGVASSGQTDSGVSARLFGTLLTWMSDHESDVFVVATSNDIGKLPPELSRAERFDGVWFLDLPSVQQRRAIWSIYLDLFGLDKQQPRPVDADFTGAEIRACCRLAALLDVPLVEAARNVVPVARTASESVERLRAWASGRCLSADGSGGIYQRNGSADSPRPGRKIRRADPSNN